MEKIRQSNYIIESKFGFWDAIMQVFDIIDVAYTYSTFEEAEEEMPNIEPKFHPFIRRLTKDEQEQYFDEIPCSCCNTTIN